MNGLSLPIVGEGLWIGRDPSCAVVLSDPAISRRHVLLLPSVRGPLLVALRREGVLLNGNVPCEEQLLRDGDEVAVFEARFSIAASPATQMSVWSLERDGVRFSLRRNPFQLGGGATDDLVVEGWPPAAATLTVVESGVVLDSEHNVLGGGLSTLDGPLTLRDRDVISFVGIRLRLLAMAGAGTTQSSRPPLPTEARLEFLPSGGLLTIGAAGQAVSIWLSDRRCDLAAALLISARDTPGAFIPDEVLHRRIWPGAPQNRLQLNTLVYRLRRALAAAGLDGPSLVERAPGGGGTRLRLAANARVSVA